MIKTFGARGDLGKRESSEEEITIISKTSTSFVSMDRIVGYLSDLRGFTNDITRIIWTLEEALEVSAIIQHVRGIS